MEIERVEFVCSAGQVEECPRRPLSEIAVSGRSNVGKSSLLNALFRRRRLAHTSGTPGKTQTLNYYLINDRFHLVDLPGYGYARVPEGERERWRRTMQAYLRTRKALHGVLQLVDARHTPSPDDREMVGWLRGERLAFCLVPTKMDKLRQGERKPALQKLVRELDLPATQPVVPFASPTGEGRVALLDWIEATLHAARDAAR